MASIIFDVDQEGLYTYLLYHFLPTLTRRRLTLQSKEWDIYVRLLHWIIVVTVTFQLFSSLFMADTNQQYLFSFHEIVGLLASLTVLMFWLYAFTVYDLPILFPWNRKGLRIVGSETASLFRGRLPKDERRIGLSSFVHGLGLLALTGNALSGIILFNMLPSGHHAAPSDPMAFTQYSIIHKFFGDLLWAYWFGHIAFALLHQFSGNNVLGKIFSLRQQDKT